MIEEKNDIKQNTDVSEKQTGLVVFSAIEGRASVSIPSRFTLFNSHRSDKSTETITVAEKANDIKQKKSDADSVFEAIVCPISFAIFLEPVKLLLENNDDGGPIIEKEVAIKLIKDKVKCPITDKAITGYLRMRNVEALVADYLINHPEAKSEQYQKQVIMNPAMIPPVYDPLQQDQDIEAAMPVQALRDREHERRVAANMVNFEQSQAFAFVIVVTLLTTGVNTMGAAILKSTGYDHNIEEVALTSAAGGATLYISVAACYVFLALYFPQQLKHIKGTIPPPNEVLGGITTISCYNIGFILSGVLGAAICGFENTTLAQGVAVAATGAAIFDCPMVAISAHEIYNARR